MALLRIVIFPEKVLRTKAEPVAKVDAAVRQLLEDMAETMYKAPGVGLAAPQVGVSKRILVVDVAPMLGPEEPNHGLLRCINPSIVKKAGTSTFEEGCLSLPGLTEEIERAAEITVEYLDHEGTKKVLEAKGILATALQHEIDHLDGVLILDYISPIKRSRYKTWLKKELKRLEEERQLASRDAEEE